VQSTLKESGKIAERAEKKPKGKDFMDEKLL
jgi:hypothetical protein